MDDLDRISLEVAISILQSEAEAPESQTPASVKLAQQILAYLQESATDLTETDSAFDPM